MFIPDKLVNEDLYTVFLPHYEKNIWIPVDPGDPLEIYLSVRTFVLKVRKSVKNLDFDRKHICSGCCKLFVLVSHSS